MAWTPWLRLKASHTGQSMLKHCDAAGEAIGAFLGITTPKYAYEISVHKRMLVVEKRRAKLLAEKKAGWTTVSQEDQPQQQQPQQQEQPQQQLPPVVSSSTVGTTTTGDEVDGTATSTAHLEKF